MALTIQDIFPLSTSQGSSSTAKLLEPYFCTKELYMPTFNVLSETRIAYNKLMSHPYYMFQYVYKHLMNWEYFLIEEFYRRMKGKFEIFYIVDWSAPYRISAAATDSITVDRTQGLQSDTGYGGNTLIIYNPTRSGTNKQILTISAIDSTTVSVNEVVTTALATARGTYMYVLYSGMFDASKINGTVVDTCIQRNVLNIEGYGSRSMFGPIMEITLPLIQIGVMK